MKRFTSPTQRLGEVGEDTAVAFLQKEGFVIIERNVSGRYGEIDIVARQASTYYFFEVKAGRVGSWFNPAENLTRAKVGKLLKTVAHYCLMHGIRTYRVEGILVKLGKGETVERIELF